MCHNKINVFIAGNMHIFFPYLSKHFNGRVSPLPQKY